MSNRERDEIKNSEHLADAANGRMNRFQAEVAAAITDVIMKHFSTLNEMDAEHIRHFGKTLTTHTWRITEDMDKLHYAVRNNLPPCAKL